MFLLSGSWTLNRCIFTLDEGSQAYTFLKKSKAAVMSIQFCYNVQ